jgi:hypothetical protein
VGEYDVAGLTYESPLTAQTVTRAFMHPTAGARAVGAGSFRARPQGSKKPSPSQALVLARLFQEGVPYSWLSGDINSLTLEHPLKS